MVDRVGVEPTDLVGRGVTARCSHQCCSQSMVLL